MCQDMAGSVNCERISALCSERMHQLQDAGQAVDAFKGQADIPPQLQALWNAEDDDGCASCHLSASGPKHAECKAKMERYGQAHQSLLDWLAADALAQTEAKDLAKLKEEHIELQNLIHYLFIHKDYKNFAFHRLTSQGQAVLLNLLQKYKLDQEAYRLSKLKE